MSDIYCIFSDESGVFDNLHERYFVFGGFILDASKGEVSKLASLYKNIESIFRQKEEYKNVSELKANNLSNHDRRFAFSKMKSFFKFGVVIDLSEVLPRIFTDKKSKQRYQDFAYKIGVRRAFEHLISIGILSPEDDITLHFFVDEHHTATNGRYELEEALLQEFKEGTYNFNFMKYYKPLFPNMRNLHLKMEDSTQSLLIRAADIVANRLYYEKERGSIRNLRGHNVYITRLP